MSQIQKINDKYSKCKYKYKYRWLNKFAPCHRPKLPQHACHASPPRSGIAISQADRQRGM